MDITVKQREIQQALMNYIAQQGITLVGKEVKITFTAGRKEAGITAEISIEDAALPDYSDVVEDVSPTAEIIPMKVETPEEIAAPVSQEDPEPAVKTSSLFG